MTSIMDHREEEQYEQSHVHDVYNSIASHFSQTRYKPWPVVDRFLKGLSPGSIGLDIGCGNGKYLAVRDDIYILGSDRSDELVKIAKRHDRHDALVGDALDPPHSAGRFDFAISIAVLHHLSTRKRRIEGVRAALNTLRPSGQSTQRKPVAGQQNVSAEESKKHGQALFFVWALEQKGSRRGWDEGGEQDVLVPWVLKPPSESSRQGKPENKTKKKGKKKKREDNAADEQYDKQNGQHLIESDPSIGDKADSSSHHDEDTPANTDADNNTTTPQHSNKNAEQVYQRYYHLYRQGELEEDIQSAGGEVVENGYDRDNWWCIARRKIH